MRGDDNALENRFNWASFWKINGNRRRNSKEDKTNTLDMLV
jgi:hypothetical protein